MSDETTPAPSAGRRWLQWMIRLLGVGLIYLVVVNVDWRDSVVLPDLTKLHGEIVGDMPRKWDDASRVRFREAGGAEREFAAAEIHRDPATGVPDVNEGIVRIVKRSDWGVLLAGVLAFGFVTQIGVLRWWLLLRAQDIRVPYAEACRLTFIGFFFNNVVPGPTGGDLVKAVYIARQADRRAPAIVTVIVDRVVGIIALALIAAMVLVFKLEDERYRELAAFIGLFLGGVAVAAMLFFSRRVRRLLRIEGLTGKLPGGGILRKADEAILRWRHHKGAVGVALLLSFVNQACIQGLMVVFAAALHVTNGAGEALPWTAYMVVLPVAFIVSALPMLPGGWGIREAAFAVCFHYVDVDRNPAIALSVVNGMTMLFWSLVGGVYFLLDRGARGSAAAASSGNSEAAS